MRNEQKSHKLNSMNHKIYQEMLITQAKSEIIGTKHDNVLNMKAQLSYLKSQSQKNLEETFAKKKIREIKFKICI